MFNILVSYFSLTARTRFGIFAFQVFGDAHDVHLAILIRKRSFVRVANRRNLGVHTTYMNMIMGVVIEPLRNDLFIFAFHNHTSVFVCQVGTKR
jgi:hypothetical protein